MKRNKKRSARKWRLSLLAAVAVAIVTALAVTGCGGSSGGSSSSEESSTTSGASQNGGASGGQPGGFEISDEARACLKEKGVEIPEGGEGGEMPQGGPPSGEGGPPGEGGEPPQGFQGGSEMGKAFQECGVELPEGKPKGGATNSASFRKSIKEYVACVRENGYDLPEANLSGEGPVFKESEVDQEDPKFKAANEKCQSLISMAGGEGEGEG